MNWKGLCLLSGLTFAAPLPAFSQINVPQQTASGAVLVAQSAPQGGTMMRQGDTMMRQGDTMMHQGNTMMQSSGAMNQPHAMLRTGSTGEQVRSVQKFLRRKGFYTGSINGVFDESTRAAVIKFQNSKKITPTGMVGPTTQGAMR
jgi:peptidoglycan hydrolase-like protein with peptidoglycan-binding domain